uniref:Uncharacterized protein n=1 Tax=Siphoviridae sp. ctZD11 TaxID=2825556 RepID=A0A8S5U552_9CAUD|nr:MAG TPA: hypothetical protein [Siphoviridae sp. ctZD11]
MASSVSPVMVFNMDSFSASVMISVTPFHQNFSLTRRTTGEVGRIRHIHATAVSGSGELGRDTGKLAVIPLGAVVKADLTEELILLTGTNLGKRLQEEVTLTGNRLINGSDHIQVQKQGRTSRKTLAKIQVDNTDGSNHTGQSDTIDLPSGGNHSKTVLHSVSVDLKQSHSVTPQAQAIGGSIGPINLLHHVGNIPQTKGLACHSGDIGGNSLHQSTGLVHGSVRGGLIVSSLNEGELNVPVNLLHFSCNLKVQLIDRVSLLTCHIQAAQSTHIGLLGIGNAYGLLKNLSHIGLLSPSDNGSVRGSQGGGFADSRLCASAGGVLLTGHELNMIGGLRPAANDGRQGTTGIALIEEHTGVVQYSKTGSKNICHKSFSFTLTICSVQPLPALSGGCNRQQRPDHRSSAPLQSSCRSQSHRHQNQRRE